MTAYINLILWITGSATLGYAFNDWKVGFGVACVSLFCKGSETS